MEIYHNPRCAKSREGLKYLEGKGYEIEIKNYMSEGITIGELRSVIQKTGKRPFDLVRTQEQFYTENFKGKILSDDEWIEVIASNPKLLQRPLVVNGSKAVLAQPPQEIEKII